MTLTRSDYRIIARALRVALRDAPRSGGTTRAGVLRAADAIADELERSSGWRLDGERRFNRVAFLEEVEQLDGR